MATFHYSFQKVVDLKTSQKTQAEWLLSDALSALSVQEMSLRELVLAKEEWEEKLQRSAQQVMPLSEVRIIGEYLEHLQTCIDKKRLDVLQAERVVEHSRSRLADKVKDEKVWLKAKDHAWDRFRHALQLKEQNELDEMATVRFMMPTP
ncbi:flagellar export protein FliJ [Paenibacillus sp. MY03]|uniref:flagellar export protein FliJ n=1 Tax=unclassified Paenibacillus TaxID=185978 RepID=UPI000B3C12E9|nr:MULTISPECIES: flagellar export protein FliJ [unclassified Paenibacillus]OUS71599.1 flagellar export protein FliJ [Paenibacillus sp. MY03]QNK54759.1 flagellar export protein FliJ [Paenibacillus sp. PAMC21692]